MDEIIFNNDGFSDGQESMLSPIKIKKINVFYFLIFVIFFALAGRLIWLQLVRGEKYRMASEGNRAKIEIIKAKRGLAYDSQGLPLVKNIASFSLLISPQNLPFLENDRQDVFNLFLEQTEGIKGIDQEVKERIEIVQREINENVLESQPSIVAKRLDYQSAIELKLITNNLPGFSVEVSAQRDYLYGPTLSHILGYVAPVTKEDLAEHKEYQVVDFIGRTGLELYYEKELRGHDGKRVIEVNALGQARKIINQEAPQDGDDIILTVNLDLQQYVKKILEEYIEEADSSAGTIIVMDPSQGEVKAMASYPYYDNNIFIQSDQERYQELSQDPTNPFLFRAIAGEYPPGSTIKPLISLAGLKEGVIDAQTSIFSQGGIRIGQWFYPDWKVGGHGSTDLIKALAESVNTFYYYLGGGFENFTGLGPEKIKENLSFLGINQKTGIDLPGEKEGFIGSPSWKKEERGKPWYIGDTYHLSIGQGYISVTPLQVATYTMALANAGSYYQPHFLKGFRDSNQNFTENKDFYFRDLTNVFSVEDFNLVREGMRAAVLKGSARRLNNLEVTIAGKTGTAQVDNHNLPHAWFTGFAPYENPEIVVVVLIENGGEGSDLAVSAAQKIFSFWFAENK
ncbi:penicillin-binding protein 2 [Patescibacteria group bacterium]|nr:penicillin-binding protein 2 [Patescibacteria group bacterium]